MAFPHPFKSNHLLNTSTMKKMLFLLSTILYSILCMGQKVDNSVVARFSVPDYLGTWYEIARLNHSFERGMKYVTAHLALTDNGTITVTNCGIRNHEMHTSVGKAKLTDTEGLLRVSFFGPFYSDYRVLMVTDDYRYALVGSRSPGFLWVLSRTPDIPDPILNEILDEAHWRGYELDKLIWVEQDVPDDHRW